MGLFDVHCAASGLALIDETMQLLIARVGDRWVPAALPAIDRYDRSGALDAPALDAAALEILARTRVSSVAAATDHPQDPYDVLAALWRELGEWQGLPLSYALFDAGVFRALAASAPPGAARETHVPKKAAWETLLQRAFPLEPTREVYRRYGTELRRVDRLQQAGRHSWRERLLWLGGFRVWNLPLVPASDAPRGQYAVGDDDAGVGDTPNGLVTRARERFAGCAKVERAILANGVAWGGKDPDADLLTLDLMVVSRAFSGQQVLEVSPHDVARIAAWLAERLVDARAAATLKSRTFSVRFARGDEPSVKAWTPGSASACTLVVTVTPEARDELVAALAGLAGKQGFADVPSLPDLRLRT